MTPHETARHSVLWLRSCQVWHSPGDVPFVTFVAMACKRSGVQIPSAPPRTPGQTIRRWQDVQLSWVRVRTPARELMRRTGLEALSVAEDQPPWGAPPAQSLRRRRLRRHCARFQWLRLGWLRLLDAGEIRFHHLVAPGVIGHKRLDDRGDRKAEEGADDPADRTTGHRRPERQPSIRSEEHTS